MRKNRGKPYLIMGIFAVLFLVVSLLIKPKDVSWVGFFYDLLMNIAFMFGTIVIVNYMWSLLGGDPVENLFRDSLRVFKLCSDGFESGLLRAHPKASVYASRWMDILGKAETSVDMMGYSLQTFTISKNFWKVLLRLAKRDVKIRILIMDKENPSINAGLNTDQIPDAANTENHINQCDEYVKKVISELDKDKKDNIQLRTIRNGFTESQIIKVDRILYFTPYMYSVNTGDSPLFVCREQEDGFFESYCDEFSTLWDLNESHNTENRSNNSN